MNDLTILPAELAELSIGQLSKLDPMLLHEVDHNLNDLVVWVRQARTKLDTALEQRFGEQVRSALRDSGRDTGTVNFTDGPLRVTAEVPKRVDWDQKELTAIVERIRASGENPSEFVEVSFRVSETKYNAWPAAWRDSFAKARTLKVGKPSFRMVLDGGES